MSLNGIVNYWEYFQFPPHLWLPRSDFLHTFSRKEIRYLAQILDFVQVDVDMETSS